MIDLSTDYLGMKRKTRWCPQHRLWRAILTVQSSSKMPVLQPLS